MPVILVLRILKLRFWRQVLVPSVPHATSVEETISSDVSDTTTISFDVSDAAVVDATISYNVFEAAVLEANIVVRILAIQLLRQI